MPCLPATDFAPCHHFTSKVLRLPRKITMMVSKVLHLPHNFPHVTKHVWISQSDTPATRNEAMRRLKPPKVTPFEELAIGTAIRASRGRLRTVANGWATSSEHTLNPQTPKWNGNPCYAFGKNVSGGDLSNRRSSKSSTPNVQITKLNLAPYLETLMGLQSQKYAAAGTHPAAARKSWKSENTRPLKWTLYGWSSFSLSIPSPTYWTYRLRTRN